MKKEYLKFIFITILIFGASIIFFREYITQILLKSIRFVNCYSLFLKNNNQIFKLIYEYKKLEKEYNKKQYLEKELNLYKKKINNNNTYNRDFLLAEIIGYIQNKKYKFFFINRGQKDGIFPNMIVVDGITILGKVIEVHSHWAKVLFLDNSEQHISVVFEKKNIKGILKGNREKEEQTMMLIHSYNNSTDIIEVGEKVYSSGKGLLFPGGYLIGTVKKINKINTLESHIIIENAYNINNLEYCEIIVDNDIIQTINNEKILCSLSNQSIE